LYIFTIQVIRTRKLYGYKNVVDGLINPGSTVTQINLTLKMEAVR
jgi:hypothetical protein